MWYFLSLKHYTTKLSIEDKDFKYVDRYRCAGINSSTTVLSNSPIKKSSSKET